MISIYKGTNILYDNETILSLEVYENSNVYKLDDLIQLLCNEVGRTSLITRDLQNSNMDSVVITELPPCSIHNSIDSSRAHTIELSENVNVDKIGKLPFIFVVTFISSFILPKVNQNFIQLYKYNLS
ncbi:hypothetical protein POVCU2_0092280 [Plasmodium ovale curtisi]|uniref:Uncharacterized protein n=1 Tax=Plasmodium ovale curtisi TaxID=864141 RepID=A0A1A8WRP0_PLAOA|nr:hypothetical protein POVCU2_0092280 [Plasmodium ovale curtisi]SBT00000.1 hypothetical protein POVCU1_056730 [Plasmodium ovale curtisi]